MRQINRHIYKIPVIGWLLAIALYVQANRAYWKVADMGLCPEYNKAYEATWTAFDRTLESFLWTMGFLFISKLFY